MAGIRRYEVMKRAGDGEGGFSFYVYCLRPGGPPTATPYPYIRTRRGREEHPPGTGLVCRTTGHWRGWANQGGADERTLPPRA